MRNLIILISCYFFSAFAACTTYMNRSMPAKHDNVNPKTIEFGGYKWIVSHTNQPAAPGPNFWSDQNVWIDAEGNLHLKLSKNAITGIWNCAELYTVEKMSTGTYRLFVEGTIDELDKHVVFGIFNYSGIDKHDEIDIEFSKWGRASGNNLTYSVWPKAGVRSARWSADTKFNQEGNYTTHCITRSASSVRFQNFHGFGTSKANSIFEAVCDKQAIINTQPMPLYLNLWLFNGNPPSDGKEVEIIIHDFSFTPGD